LAQSLEGISLKDADVATVVEAKIDPVLLEELSEAEQSNGHVEAVVRLRAPSGDSILIPPVTKSLAEDLLQRVAGSVGFNAEFVNIFRNLGSFLVVAQPTFLRELISQPEVAAAVANRQHDAFIEPVNKRPSHIESVGASSRARRERSSRRTSSRKTSHR
jgi:hypothetical protein